jgi:hypothetical protein
MKVYACSSGIHGAYGHASRRHYAHGHTSVVTMFMVDGVSSTLFTLDPYHVTHQKIVVTSMLIEKELANQVYAGLLLCPHLSPYY